MSSMIGERRRRQELLHVGQPRGVEPLRFAVGDARRRVAIADEDQPAVEPSLQIGLPLVAVRHVQQLHDVGPVLALAGERAGDLLADRRAVIGKRHQPRFVAILLEPITQQLRLGLLAALVEPFERDEETRPSLCFQRKHVVDVCRRRTTRHAPSSTITSAGRGRRL